MLFDHLQSARGLRCLDRPSNQAGFAVLKVLSTLPRIQAMKSRRVEPLPEQSLRTRESSVSPQSV